MKKLVVVAFTCFAFAGCTESSSNKEENTINTTNPGTDKNPGATDASQREKEIRDSTKMLDLKLNDTSDKTNLDSL